MSSSQICVNFSLFVWFYLVLGNLILTVSHAAAGDQSVFLAHEMFIGSTKPSILHADDPSYYPHMKSDRILVRNVTNNEERLAAFDSFLQSLLVPPINTNDEISSAQNLMIKRNIPKFMVQNSRLSPNDQDFIQSELFSTLFGDVITDDDTNTTSTTTNKNSKHKSNQNQAYHRTSFPLEFVNQQSTESKSLSLDPFESYINQHHHESGGRRFIPLIDHESEMKLFQTRSKPIPDVNNRKSIVSLAIMASNAYVTPSDRDWIDLGDWDSDITTTSSGTTNGKWWYRRPADGLKAQIFVSKDQSLAIIAFKGTSPLGNNYDRLNDNMMFSCCCGRGKSLWTSVCECDLPRDHIFAPMKCSVTCLESNSKEFEHSYYFAARQMFRNVRKLYPKAAIWFTGHSLGGGVASMMAITTGNAAITYQSPGERVFASRLGFDIALQNAIKQREIVKRQGNLYSLDFPVFHIGNSADPIFNGLCNSALSWCTIGGYALETKCRVGKQCIYSIDRSNDITYHRMDTVIKDVLLRSDHVPACEPVWYQYPGTSSASLTPEEKKKACTDCQEWRFE